MVVTPFPSTGPREARIYVINELGANDGGLGAADFNYVFGNPGDKPFVGDFDGNGVDTVGLHRESTGFVYFRNTHTQGNANAEFFFGDPGDRLVAGDWGVVNRVDTPAVFRPSNTTFYFRHTNTQGNANSQFAWGQPGLASRRRHLRRPSGDPASANTTTPVPPPSGFPNASNTGVPYGTSLSPSGSITVNSPTTHQRDGCERHDQHQRFQRDDQEHTSPRASRRLRHDLGQFQRHQRCDRRL